MASYITFLGLVFQAQLQLKQEFRAIRTSLLRAAYRVLNSIMCTVLIKPRISRIQIIQHIDLTLLFSLLLPKERFHKTWMPLFCSEKKNLYEPEHSNESMTCAELLINNELLPSAKHFDRTTKVSSSSPENVMWIEELQSQSKSVLGHFAVFLHSQYWCTRFGELIAINTIGKTRWRARSKKQKTALGGSVPTIFLYESVARNCRTLVSFRWVPWKAL